MQLPTTNKRRSSIYIDQKTEDRIMIHAARHKIKKLATMIQILMEEGLDARDLLEKGE
jgi:hypothetical protein